MGGLDDIMIEESQSILFDATVAAGTDDAWFHGVTTAASAAVDCLSVNRTVEILCYFGRQNNEHQAWISVGWIVSYIFINLLYGKPITNYTQGIIHCQMCKL